MWGRASAAIVPGFFAAVAASGLLCWLPPGPWQGAIVPSLVAFFPLWVGIACAAFQFRDGRRAWLWLSGLALAGLGVLKALQQLAWVY